MYGCIAQVASFACRSTSRHQHQLTIASSRDICSDIDPSLWFQRATIKQLYQPQELATHRRYTSVRHDSTNDLTKYHLSSTPLSFATCRARGVTTASGRNTITFCPCWYTANTSSFVINWRFCCGPGSGSARIVSELRRKLLSASRTSSRFLLAIGEHAIF